MLRVTTSATLHWSCWVNHAICEWFIDMPKLKSLLLGWGSFSECSRAVFESEWIEGRMMNRLAWIDCHSTRMWRTAIQGLWQIHWISNAKCFYKEDMMNRFAWTDFHATRLWRIPIQGLWRIHWIGNAKCFYKDDMMNRLAQTHHTHYGRGGKPHLLLSLFLHAWRWVITTTIFPTRHAFSHKSIPSECFPMQSALSIE